MARRNLGSVVGSWRDDMAYWKLTPRQQLHYLSRIEKYNARRLHNLYMNKAKITYRFWTSLAITLIGFYLLIGAILWSVA